MSMLAVMSLHDGSVVRNSLPAVAPVNDRYARQARRLHITRLLDGALERNGTVLDEVAAAMAGRNVLVVELAQEAKRNGVAMASTSTIVGAALIHAAWAGAAEQLVAAGHVPEVRASANRGPAVSSSSS